MGDLVLANTRSCRGHGSTACRPRADLRPCCWMPRSPAPEYVSISGAIDFLGRLLSACGYQPDRQVIDISEFCLDDLDFGSRRHSVPRITLGLARLSGSRVHERQLRAPVPTIRDRYRRV